MFPDFKLYHKDTGNQNRMGLTQTESTMEQNTEPRNKLKHL